MAGEKLGVVKEYVERGLLPHACLFYGNDENAKNEAVELLLKHNLGDVFQKHPDFYEVNSNPITIGEVRTVRGLASLAPATANKRIFLIRNIDTLSRDAAHAMLKFLEDPSPDAIFLATSANFSGILPTIRSRFIHFRFWSLNIETISTKKAVFLKSLSYSERFAKVKEILDNDSFTELINEAQAQVSLLARKSPGPKEVFALEEMIKIKRSLEDPTISKRLLCEYFMMIL